MFAVSSRVRERMREFSEKNKRERESGMKEEERRKVTGFREGIQGRRPYLSPSTN